MARNVEIKARIPDIAAVRSLVAVLANRGPESLSQTDTFFRVPSGRLKLREFPDGAAELIFYHRPDSPGPAESEWARATVPDGPALRELLTAALGVRGQVSKRRLVFWVGRTRVHLDEVQDLGAFLELEVVLAEGEPVSIGVDEAHPLHQSGFTFSPASDAEVARDKAFGYFTLGVALGDIALVYDSGAVVSANDDVKEAAAPFVGHDSLMGVAMAYLDTAQQLASVSPAPSGSNGFPLPSTWINGQALTGGPPGTFVQLVRSWKARFRAGVARTPADRAAVNWQQVISDAQAGLTSDFSITMVNGSPAWTYRPAQMDLADSWHKMWGYMVVMADSSGNYSRYLANPVSCSPCLVVTPDRRFPSGNHRESSGPADTGATGSQSQNSGCTATSCLQPAATAPYPYLKCRRGSQDAGGASFALGFSMYDFYRF